MVVWYQDKGPSQPSVRKPPSETPGTRGVRRSTNTVSRAAVRDRGGSGPWVTGWGPCGSKRGFRRRRRLRTGCCRQSEAAGPRPPPRLLSRTQGGHGDAGCLWSLGSVRLCLRSPRAPASVLSRTCAQPRPEALGALGVSSQPGPRRPAPGLRHVPRRRALGLRGPPVGPRGGLCRAPSSLQLGQRRSCRALVCPAVCLSLPFSCQECHTATELVTGTCGTWPALSPCVSCAHNYWFNRQEGTPSVKLMCVSLIICEVEFFFFFFRSCLTRFGSR